MYKRDRSQDCTAQWRSVVRRTDGEYEHEIGKKGLEGIGMTANEAPRN